MHLVKLLFIFLLLIFPLGQIGRVELGGGVNILLNDIVVFLVVLTWVIRKLIKKESVQNRVFAKPLAYFVGLAFISLAFNPLQLPISELMVSSLYLLRWVAYALLFFVVSGFDDSFKRKIPYALVAIGVVTAFIGFIQYGLYPNLRNLYYAGWDDHLYRLFSSFLDPNFSGGIFVLTCILAVSQFLLQKERPFEARLAIGAIASFLALLLTYSRGSFLSFFAGILTLLFMTARKKLLLMVLFAFVIGIVLLPKNLKSEGVELLRTASINQRIESVEHAVAIFKEYPLLGIGFNTYRYAQVKYRFLTHEQAATSHSAAGTDNSFLFVLATTGILGFAAYLYLWGTILRMYWSNSLIIASCMAIFIHAFFVNSLFYPWIMEWVWILLGASKAQKLL